MEEEGLGRRAQVAAPPARFVSSLSPARRGERVQR